MSYGHMIIYVHEREFAWTPTCYYFGAKKANKKTPKH